MTRSFARRGSATAIPSRNQDRSTPISWPDGDRRVRRRRTDDPPFAWAASVADGRDYVGPDPVRSAGLDPPVAILLFETARESPQAAGHCNWPRLSLDWL